jgi:hypothetical protein
MSYESTVLAKTPVVFYRFDELSGSVIPDSSGNAHHGAYDSLVGYGLASPIETDPASRAVNHFAGILPLSLGGVLDIKTAFTWECWGYYSNALLTAGTAHLITRNGQWGLNGSNLLGFNGGGIVAAVYIGLGDPNLFSYSVSKGSLQDDTWYYMALVRNGNTIQLYVNGYLADQDASLPTDDMNPSGVTQWTFGASPTTGAFQSAGLDEVAIYDYALSAGEILENYEAARATLPMYAVITGRSSVALDSSPPPVYSPFPYSHDFNSPIIERLSRPTEVSEAIDGTEERSAQATQTRRTLSHSVAIMDAQARRQLAGILNYNQGQPIPWPISQDELELTAPITAGDTVISVLSTDYRDFDPAGRALIFSSEFAFEQIEIASLNPLTAVDPIESNWPITARIVPLKLAIIDQELPLLAHTSRLQDASVRASILVEEIAAEPNRITPYTPAYTYRSVEVFDPRVWGLSDYNDPLNHDTVQKSELLDAKTGLFRLDSSDVEVSRPGFAYQLELDGREVISKFLGWYEERAGRLNKLWVPTYQEDFNLVSMTGSTITVKESAYEATYNVADHRRDLALVQKDGTLAFRRINSVAPSGANEVLTVNSSVSSLATTTNELCFLAMCRLDADEIELAWWTDNCVSVSLRFRELPNEIS